VGYSTHAPRGDQLAQPGSVGGSPERVDVSTYLCDILCCPFTTDYTDLTGNHTWLPGNSVITAGSNLISYNGETSLRTVDGGGASVKTSASEPEHAIGGTDPVTFGFFLRVTFWNSTSQFMTSAASGGDANYGLIRFTNGDWGFRGATGGGSGSAWRVMINRFQEDGNVIGRWFHVAMRCEDGVNEGTFFWNGNEIWTGALGTNGRHVATPTDILSLNEASPTSDNPQWEGYMNNAFVAGRDLSNAEIKQLSDEAHGHSSPWTRGAPVP